MVSIHRSAVSPHALIGTLLLIVITSSCRDGAGVGGNPFARLKSREVTREAQASDSLRLELQMQREAAAADEDHAAAMAAADARADSIGRERMQDVMSAFDDVPASAPVVGAGGVESTREYEDAMQFAGQGAGFDCSRTTGTVEQAICGDPGLSALDKSLKKHTDAALRAGRVPSPTDAAWRAVRLPACMSGADPVGCLRSAYVERIRLVNRR